MKKSDWIGTMVIILMVGMIGFWCIDVSMSAMLNDGYLTNGFWTADPMKMYHFGLYLSILSMVFVGFIAIHHIHGDENRKEDDDIQVSN